MLKYSKQSPRRTGFTLVEMLVAAAVSILLMVIITGAFTQGLDMFRKLRSQAKLQDTLRQAGTAIKDDLSWNHFQMPGQFGSSGYGDDTAYVRGQDLTRAGTDWKPPPDGFFRIVNGNDPLGSNANVSNPFIFDGSDAFNYPFTRATTHAIHFTVQRPASGPDQMFRTLDQLRGAPFVTPNQNPALMFPNSFVDPTDYREQIVNPAQVPFSTRWAEVAYYLVPVSTGDTANGVPLFNLYRAQKLLLPLPVDNGGVANAPTSLGGGPSTAQIVVGVNGAPAGSAAYNTEMSRRYIPAQPTNKNAPDPRQFNPVVNNPPPVTTVVVAPPPGGQDVEAYNRTNDVTQPCNRFGALPASGRMPRTPVANGPPQRPSNHSQSFRNVAGLPQIATTPAAGFTAYRYPVMADNPQFGVGTNDNRANNDLLLMNVISFEIKAYWTGSPAPAQFYTVPGLAQPIPNADFPFDYIPLSTTNLALANRGLRVFDTWSAAPNSPYSFQQTIGTNTLPPMWQRTDVGAATGVVNPDDTAARLPLRIRVRAVQIRIRIWDQKSEQTRQVTIVQDV